MTKKYIDAEKLKAEIKRQKHELELSIQSQGDYGQSCHIVAYDNILSLIDSLPEEPAPKGYDESYLNECIAKASKTWKGVDVDKYMDEVRGNRPKLSDNSLDEEIAGMYQALFGTDVIYRKERLYLDTFEAIARHFFELGRETTKQELESFPLQQRLDINAAIIDYYGRVPDDEDKVAAAIHFFKLGKNAK